MNNTETKINQQGPSLAYNINAGATALPFDAERDLDKYSRIYITKEFDPFSTVHYCEYAIKDYVIYGPTQEGDKKILFRAIVHHKCCECCEQCIIGYLWCGYACCDSIQFQMDYKREGRPFYTQGYNIVKGCHCCDICLLNGFCGFCDCAGDELYLRENIDPNSPDIKVGRKKGKTIANCCCSCDKYVKYETENHLRGQTVRAECCDLCVSSCTNTCCCHGCDLEMAIEDENRLKAGRVRVFSGFYSEKVEGKCCHLPRAYFEVDMPPNANSEQKFQIIADLIHFDLSNNII